MGDFVNGAGAPRVLWIEPFSGARRTSFVSLLP
jgi:hypothetical protein